MNIQQEYFYIKLIYNIFENKNRNDNIELNNLILENNKIELLNKLNELISNCVFIQEIIRCFKSVDDSKTNMEELFIKLGSESIKTIKYNPHRCVICNEIYMNFKNVRSILTIISDYVNDERKTYECKKCTTNYIKQSDTLGRHILGKKIENQDYIKEIVTFFRENFNGNQIIELGELWNINTNHRKSLNNVKDTIINCKFIKLIEHLIKTDDYPIIINKMKRFKSNKCILSKILYDFFNNTSSNISIFLDIFKKNNSKKDDNDSKKEDNDSKYLIDGDFSNRKFTIFRWHIKCDKNQWIHIFKDINIFKELKKRGFFIKLIGLIRYTMLPLVFFKNNPNNYSIENYELFCNMSIKEWNKYSKKHIDSFLSLDRLSCDLLLENFSHESYVNLLKSYKEIIKTNNSHTQDVYNYIMNVDYNDPIKCFLALQLKINEDCKELLYIFTTLNNMNKPSSLKKFLNKNKIIFLNDILGNIIQKWINIDKDRIKILSVLNSKYIDINNEYHISYLYDIDKIAAEVLKDDLSIKIMDDIEIDEAEYSPDTVQKMIEELKD